MTLKGRVLQSVTVLGALLLIVAGCSRDSGGGDAQEEKKTVKIGVIAPLTGNLSELGLGIKNSVDLAVRQANEKGTVPGYEVVLAAEDDAADPATGANAANKLASDPQVAGVVGTLNSSVAQSVAPVLAKANITQISPANTNPTLTRGDLVCPGRAGALPGNLAPAACLYDLVPRTTAERFDGSARRPARRSRLARDARPRRGAACL